MNKTRVLALLPLFLGWAHSFSWDIVVAEKTTLAFYCNGTLTHAEEVPSAMDIRSITYDPVHYRVLFADLKDSNMSISSFDLSSRKIQPLFTRESGGYYARVVYDPVRQLLFWKKNTNIYSCSLKPASSNEAIDETLLVSLDHYCRDIALDSCERYIYWITDSEIERARFDGSGREVLINTGVTQRESFTIDLQTQTMYWIDKTYASYSDYHLSIKTADVNGKNIRTLKILNNENQAHSLTVSKDFIYWHGNTQHTIWQLPKNMQNDEEAKIITISNRTCVDCQFIAANYSIKEQTQGILKCEALKNLTQNKSEPESKEASLLCVHGTKVSGESRCECTQGYTGERCDVSLCHNYCLQGDCSVSAEGQPTCSCKPGYSGERCEVNECYMYCLNNGVCSLNEADEPFCECTAGYEGERCDVSISKGNGLQGNCSVNTEGQPKCRCNSGHSVERCEVISCPEYCLNDGVCSLNEKNQPVCRCTAGYEGARCDVPVYKDLRFQAACSVSAEGQPQVTVTLGRAAESTCSTQTREQQN